MNSTAMPTLPVRAEHIGSLLRPAGLIEVYRAFLKGEVDATQLRAAQEAAIREAVELQEAVGLRVVTDGEFRRTTYISHFVDACEGLDFRPSKFRFHDGGGVEHVFVAPTCVGKVRRVKANSGEEFDFLKTVTSEIPKMTLPSPATMHFLAGADVPDFEFYANTEELLADIAQAYNEDLVDLAARGARYVQLDDVPFAMLCDPNLRAQMEARGQDPEQFVDQYIELTNASLRGLPAEVTTGFHICRGNLKGTWLSAGSYQAVAEKIFRQLDVDVFFLEYDTERAGGFEPLAAMPVDKLVVLGLVSSKVPELEFRDDLMARIEAASRYVAKEQLGLSPQCGFSSAVVGNPVSVADQVAKLKLIVETCDAVWGSH